MESAQNVSKQYFHSQNTHQDSTHEVPTIFVVHVSTDIDRRRMAQCVQHPRPRSRSCGGLAQGGTDFSLSMLPRADNEKSLSMLPWAAKETSLSMFPRAETSYLQARVARDLAAAMGYWGAGHASRLPDVSSDTVKYAEGTQRAHTSRCSG